MTRDITPHKGGRTERISARITPEDKAAIIARCEYLGITISDFIAAAARKAARDTMPWHRPKEIPTE